MRTRARFLFPNEPRRMPMAGSLGLLACPDFSSRYAQEDLAGVTDWPAVGLLLMILGVLLLAQTLLFRSPREFLEQQLGSSRRKLQSIRGFVFQRVQLSIGFVLLLVGLTAQLLGRYQPSVDEPEFPLGWVGALVFLLAALEGLGWWFARLRFRQAVRRFLLAGEVVLESDSKLAREVGELFGVVPAPEDTVHDYAQRVRERVGLTLVKTMRSPGAAPAGGIAPADGEEFEDETFEGYAAELAARKAQSS